MTFRECDPAKGPRPGQQLFLKQSVFGADARICFCRRMTPLFDMQFVVPFPVALSAPSICSNTVGDNQFCLIYLLFPNPLEHRLYLMHRRAGDTPTEYRILRNNTLIFISGGCEDATFCVELRADLYPGCEPRHFEDVTNHFRPNEIRIKPFTTRFVTYFSTLVF